MRLAAFQVSPRTSWSVGSAAPNFLLFSLLPKKVRAGETATLCISVDHAKKLYVSGLGTFNPKLTTCRTFAPKRTTSFVAYVLNARGQRTKRRVTVVVERTVFVEEPLYKSRRLHRRRIAL